MWLWKRDRKALTPKKPMPPRRKIGLPQVCLPKKKLAPSQKGKEVPSHLFPYTVINVTIASMLPHPKADFQASA